MFRVPLFEFAVAKCSVEVRKVVVCMPGRYDV